MPLTSEPNGPEAMMTDLLAATRLGRQEARDFWMNSCELCSRYFAALARADGLEGVFAANTDLVTGGMDAIVKSTSALRRMDGAGAPPPQV